VLNKQKTAYEKDSSKQKRKKTKQSNNNRNLAPRVPSLKLVFTVAVLLEGNRSFSRNISH